MSKNSNNQSLSAETSALNANTNSLLNPYQTTLANTAPTLYNTSRVPVTYNGFKWSFNTNVDWGRFISGEPFVIVPPAGIIVTGISYENDTGDGAFEDCPTIKTGWTSAQYQNLGINGVTMWVNGSMKNPSPWYHNNALNWATSKVGHTLQKWIYDERLSAGVSDRKNHDVNRGTGLAGHPISDFLQFPVGLSAGDVLVTAKSNFNPNSTQARYPQGENIWVSWTDPLMYRLIVEKYGILTTIPQNSGPTYADCYRPPVMWNGASLSNRPIFYRHQMVKNTEDYLFDMPQKTVYGDEINLSSPNIQQEINLWNDYVNRYWISSVMPYNSGYATERALGAMDNYNEDRSEPKGGYPSGAIKVRDQIFQSIFAPWVTVSNRKKALDKSIQYAIDNWGVINAGGFSSPQGGGYCNGQSVPWLSFLGWAYDRNDIKNWHNNTQLRNRLRSTERNKDNGSIINGISGGKWEIGQIQVPESYYIKALTSQDYGQHLKLRGSSVQDLQGFTFAVLTNPNINLYHGLTTPSEAIGATGIGWIYKATGISCAFAYTLSQIELSNDVISGSFGAIVAHKDFVVRQNSLGIANGLPGPAELPLKTNSAGQLLKRGFQDTDDTTEFWGYKPETLLGAKLQITSGPGSGPTEYTILDTYNIFIKRGDLEKLVPGEEPAEEVEFAGSAQSLQYATFVLDRDFENNVVPTSESTFKFYPAGPTLERWAFTAFVWYAGWTAPTKDTLPINTKVAYNHIADETLMKHTAIMNWIGNTFEQPLIDYIRETYWDTRIPSYIRRDKILGSAYIGSIFDSSNILGGNIIVQGFGVTGATFFPKNTLTSDLPGASDSSPAVPLDGITLEFIPEFVSGYSVPGGSGKTYSGYGKVFDTPKTVFNIKAFIDDKIFVDHTQPTLYTLFGKMKIRFGPFLTDQVKIETREDEDQYLDRIAFYGFGEQRSSSNAFDILTGTKYIRELPNLQTLANNQQPISMQFYSSRFSAAGAAGILPKNKNSPTNLLTSSYGMGSIKRIDDNKFIVGMDGNVYDNTINISDIYYCISSPFVTGASAMADEYKFSNWKKVKNAAGFFSGLNIVFDTENVPVSNNSTGNYTTNTDDKLIFFKYIIDFDRTSLSFREVEVPAPTGITQSQWPNINSTNYAGWTSTDLFKVYKIDQMTTNNTAGNKGLFRLIFNNSTVNDYRRKSYNHFRLFFNNYYDLETSAGIPAFYSRMPNAFEVLENQLHNYTNISLNSKFQDSDGKFYFSSNGGSVVYSSIIGSGSVGGIGFYDQYIRGLTFTLMVPPTPHTLLWCTGSTL